VGVPGSGAPDRVNTREEIQAALDLPLWFVVGLGDNPDRDAYWVALTLKQHGHRIVPIYPRAQTVHGEAGFATIADAVESVGAPDVVDVFVRADRAGAFADQAIAAGAKAVWFQFGVIDQDAASRVEAAGLTMIMDRCPKVEMAKGHGAT